MFYKNSLHKGVQLTSLPHFVFIFLRKIFLMLYYIKWPNLFFRLPLIFEILDSMCIAIICCLVSDIINFEINLNFLIKLLFYRTKMSGKKWKYLKIKESCQHKKAFLITFSEIWLKKIKMTFFGRWESDFKQNHRLS